MPRFPWFVYVFALTLTCAAQILAGRVDAQGVSLWNGVYTTGQADRGKAVYARHCSRCRRWP